ncbi:MAG: chorismate synthase, partial [Clostridia bacterium]|nr:chorismate synthase [Clostridia bacterium]
MPNDYNIMIKFFVKGFSHGDGYHCKAIGLPKGFKVDISLIQEQLLLRRQGVGRSQRMTTEQDVIEFFSGLDDCGKTDGNDLTFFIRNVDNTLATKPSITALRSGHADLVGSIKLNLQDARQVCELSSARRTVAYTAFGAICKQILAQYGIFTYSYLRQIGKVVANDEFDYFVDKKVLARDLRTKDDSIAKLMQQEILDAKEIGDSIGGKVCVGCVGLPIGVGDFINYENKLDGILSKAMMSIPSVKSVEFGLGPCFASQTNTQVADNLTVVDDKVLYGTNNCGGVVGGLSTNKPITMTLTVKPVPTTKKSVETIDIQTKQKVLSHYERSDTCVVQNVGIIAENILATTILDQYLNHIDAKVVYKKFNKNDFNTNTVFVVDKNVYNQCNFSNDDSVILIDDPENDKNLNKAIEVLQFVSSKNLSKNDDLVAIGGGALLDLCGFVASIFKRGLNFYSVPTTLLSMVDAGHGGKNALNFDGAKNLLGTFYLPKQVIIDFDFLISNTQSLIDEGFGEIIKCSLLNNSLYNALNKDSFDLKTLIKQCVSFKNQVV